MEARSEIDQAVGVIMAVNRCTGREAFAILRSASEHRNVELRDVATTIIDNLLGTTRTCGRAPASELWERT